MEANERPVRREGKEKYVGRKRVLWAGNEADIMVAPCCFGLALNGSLVTIVIPSFDSW
jgi:hypothetical protein